MTIGQNKEGLKMSNSNITEKAIQDAFLELLNEKSFNKITVRDITDRCGINRNTFYYHYQDIYELLEGFCAGEVDRVVRQFPQLTSLEECLNGIMDLIKINKRAIMHIFNSNNREIYVTSLWRVCEHAVRTYANAAFGDAPVSESDKELFIRYYKCSCFGLIMDWINSGMKDEYAEGVRRICALKKGTADLTISNCRASYNS